MIDKPIDAVILVVGLLSARPIARLVLRATGAGRLLARIALPVRLLLGFAVTLLFAWVFLAIVGVSPRSRFFNMVIAVAVGIVIMQIFLGDGDAKPARAAGRARRAIEGAVIGTVLQLAMPLAALADNGEATADAAAATGVAGAAAAAAALAWAFLTGLFSKVPRPISTLERLASEEGAKGQQGALDMIQARAAQRAGLDGQGDRADQIRNMSTGEFYQAAKNGDFSDLGIAPW